VIDPCDAVEFGKALEYAANVKGPVYIRSSRGMLPVVFSGDMEFRADKAVVLQEGEDIALITTGASTSEGILACESLAQSGVSVKHLHVPVLKPIDGHAIVRAAKETRRVVTCENHNIIGGLGSAVAEVLSEACPVPVHRLGIRDMFGETADFEYLKAKYKIDADAIRQKILETVGK